jgi:hypothetical protein
VKDGNDYNVGSNSNNVLFLDGINLSNDRNKKDKAYSWQIRKNLPKNIGYARKDNDLLYFSGANDRYFSAE